MGDSFNWLYLPKANRNSRVTAQFLFLLLLSSCAPPQKEPDIPLTLQQKIHIDFNDEHLDLLGREKYAVFTHMPFARSPGDGRSASQPVVSDFRVQFSGGVEEQRWARLINEDNGLYINRILEFGLASSYRDIESHQTKGRVQLNASIPQGARYLLVELKIKLGDGFEYLRVGDIENRWLTIAEWWNEEVWSDSPYGFSLGVNLVKLKNTNKLFFNAHGRTFSRQDNKFRFLWKQTNRDFEVPIGEWLRVKYFIVEGKNGEGQFKMYVAKSDGDFKEIFAVNNSTVHPDNPSPDGITAFNPLKLYTGDCLLTYLKRHQQTLSLLFDDVSISFE